jgi:LmbE family N-acetylglucosaminyl deacetylase
LQSSVLFVGAHADDLEIGCGGALAKLSAAGWVTWVCVLTDEPDPAAREVRRQEAIEGAAFCGVAPDHVLFLGAPDAGLACDGTNVSGLRSLLRDANCKPDLVVTHTRADSHGDHRAAHDLVLSTFRKKPILCFAVVNSLVSSAFQPHTFIDITSFFERKIKALKSHRSQTSRIDFEAIDQFSRRFVKDEDRRVEAFELVVQEGGEKFEHLAINLNDDAFHGFWFHQIHHQGVTNLYSEPVARLRAPAWRGSLEREGYGELLRAFARRWGNQLAIDEMPAGSQLARHALVSSHCIISGGSAANPLAEMFLARQGGLRYATRFEGPQRGELHIVDHERQTSIYPSYYKDGEVGTGVLVDFGVLSVQPNPMNPAVNLIACMGIHGFGTKACFHVLSNPRLLGRLPARTPFQVLVRYDAQSDEVSLVEGSLHLIREVAGRTLEAAPSV